MKTPVRDTRSPSPPAPVLPLRSPTTLDGWRARVRHKPSRPPIPPPADDSTPAGKDGVDENDPRVRYHAQLGLVETTDIIKGSLTAPAAVASQRGTPPSLPARRHRQRLPRHGQTHAAAPHRPGSPGPPRKALRHRRQPHPRRLHQRPARARHARRLVRGPGRLPRLGPLPPRHPAAARAAHEGLHRPCRPRHAAFPHRGLPRRRHRPAAARGSAADLRLLRLPRRRVGADRLLERYRLQRHPPGSPRSSLPPPAASYRGHRADPAALGAHPVGQPAAAPLQGAPRRMGQHRGHPRRAAEPAPSPARQPPGLRRTSTGSPTGSWNISPLWSAWPASLPSSTARKPSPATSCTTLPATSACPQQTRTTRRSDRAPSPHTRQEPGKPAAGGGSNPPTPAR
ncbi:hypothetical protein DWG14_08465 [Streptomyces griseorubiginosus]|uniref:Uncharacterized protein n=1 Tax=Streptomyces griseorubiginosus TaxID=67304 RepID=A0AAI8LAA6_9ACTN|nr:hypothetical protein DWG14_08465 [Streptomyces griseorubiginosus]